MSFAFILFAIRHDTCERLNARREARCRQQHLRQTQRHSTRALCVCLVAFKVHRKLISFRFVSISQKTSMEFSLHVFAFLSAPPTPPPPFIVVIIIVVAYNISNNNITSSPAVVVAVVVVVVASTFPWRFQCTTKNNVKRGQRAANEAAQPAATPTAITLTAAAAAAARWGQRVEPWPGAASLSPLGLWQVVCLCFLPPPTCLALLSSVPTPAAPVSLPPACPSSVVA